MNNSESTFRQGVAGNCVFFLCVLAAAPSYAASAENEVAPLNYFLHSYGPASTPTMHLGWVFAALLVAIFIIIALLLVGAILRKRQAEDPRAIGREDEGMPWIYIGTGVSTCILFVLALYTLITLNEVAKPAHAPALTLTVTGYDWWWKVEFEDDDPTRRFVTANDLPTSTWHLKRSSTGRLRVCRSC